MLNISDESLCRLFYVDIMFNQFTRGDEFTNGLLQEKLGEIKKESEGLSIKDVKKKIIEVNQNNEDWYNRFVNRSFVKKKIPTDKLFFDDFHNAVDNVSNCSGKSIAKFLEENKNNEEVKTRINFIVDNFELISKYLPIIVRKKDDVFEVMTGNHRVMAHIEKGYSEIECLVIL